MKKIQNFPIFRCSFRLWLPQLFKMMSESAKGSLCEMISLGNNVNILKPIYSNASRCEPVRIQFNVICAIVCTIKHEKYDIAFGIFHSV